MTEKPAHVPHGQEFRAVLRDARNSVNASLNDLARDTYTSRGWINNVEAGRRWPSREWVLSAQAILRTESLLPAWEIENSQRDSDIRIKNAIKESEREAHFLLSIEPDTADIETINESVADLAVAYLANPAEPMFNQGIALRGELVRRVKSGAFHPRERLDLLTALGRVSGVLSYATLDLGQSTTAMLHAEVARKMGTLAGSSDLVAWAYGTESLIERFDQHYEHARDLLLSAGPYLGAGTSAIRVLCGLAQCSANLGDTRAAMEYIAQAKKARDIAGEDAVEGLFTFSPAKQEYYTASALMWLPDQAALKVAEESATRAIAIWEHEPVEQRSLDDEALTHVYLATSRIKLGEIEGAMAAVRPVLDLPNDRQISWIRKRVGELSNLITTDSRYKRSRTASAAVEELRTPS
ncbi:helix-turn-helix transcriptional regulator [Nocardia sp. NPDC005366]|uniref:helix-turn-helix domain-containing protein n=1 Tax=Nocardia sp. NPDC005366 TaxID=3156878 RepID=UPI0033AAF7C8